MTSADVKASYDRIVHPPAGVVSIRQAAYEDITTIDTPDPLTVIFKMKAPVASMLLNFASPWDVIYSAAKLKEDPARDQGTWPDLVLIDGGPGQLAAALAVLAGLGIEDMSVAAIAKGSDRDAGRERIHLPGREPITLANWEKWSPRLREWSGEYAQAADPAFQRAFDFLKKVRAVKGDRPVLPKELPMRAIKILSLTLAGFLTAVGGAGAQADTPRGRPAEGTRKPRAPGDDWSHCKLPIGGGASGL